MPDLAEWVQPQHLDPAALAEYRRSFGEHPAATIVLKDFLVEAVASQLYTFLSSEAAFETRYGLYSHHDDPVSKQEWLAAPEADRFYRYGRLNGVHAPVAPSQNLLRFLQFRTAWSDEPFAEFFREATGLPLAASPLDNAHAFKQGDFLLSHRDDHDIRRLAVILYLSHGWRPEYGGSLELVDRHGRATTIAPDFNSLVLFDVHAGSLHQIRRLDAAAGGRARLTMGGWLDGV